MIAILRRRSGVIIHFVKMLWLILVLGKPTSAVPISSPEPVGAVDLLRPVSLKLDQCCLVSLATAIGIANHEGLLSMRELGCLGGIMNELLAGVDRPTQEAIAAGDARGRRMIGEQVAARLFAAAGSSPSMN